MTASRILTAMNESSIYLDNNATTEIDRSVADAISAVLRNRLSNPASQHAAGRKARSILEASRTAIATSLGCRTHGMSADQVVFTSGGTESNHLALVGILDGLEGDLVVSSIEHPSILGVAMEIARRDARRVRYLPVDANGRVCLETWNRWLLDHDAAVTDGDKAGRIAMISLMVANNETGSIQPLGQVAESASSRGILVHTDAVQAIGKIPLRFSEIKADAMSVTAHKYHGPVGIGALVLRHGVHVTPVFQGGFQQMGLRPGTESVALAVGFSKATEIAVGNIDERNRMLAELRIALENILLTSPHPPIILGAAGPRLPHTISLSYPWIERQALQMALDRRGIACSTGSACASGSGQPSHVLQAMHLPESVVSGAIRLSLSVHTTLDEVLEAGRRITEVVGRFRDSRG